MSDERPYTPGGFPPHPEPPAPVTPDAQQAPYDAPAAPVPAVPVSAAPAPGPAQSPAHAWAQSTQPAPAVPVPTAAHAQPQHAPSKGIGAGLAVTIALIGVILAAVIGTGAGFLGARIGGGGSGTAGSAAVVTSPTVTVSGTDEPVAAAAALALPAVVNIDVTSDGSASGLPQGHPDVPSGGTGSGVAYKATPDGGTYIITNNHVVTGANSIRVTVPNGETVDGTLVGTDPETDIAVVKISQKLPTLAVANSDQLLVGQMVVAIGSPFGLQHSVSSGVVSALHRSITSSSNGTSTTDYSLVDAIQTDAAINPGNSGGALVDREGRLVGINSAIYTESGNNAGVGFAIPSNTATRIADELITGRGVTHPFLGIEGTDVSQTEAQAAGMPDAQGAIVANVIPGTSAAQAGIKQGDIIVAIDDTPIRSMNDLILSVRRHVVGDTISVTLWRDNSKMTLEMKLGDKPANL